MSAALIEARQRIMEWAGGNPDLLSARCAKAEQALEAMQGKCNRQCEADYWQDRYDAACACLTHIANADYRGNRSTESITAHKFLVSVGLRK